MAKRNKNKEETSDEEEVEEQEEEEEEEDEDNGSDTDDDPIQEKINGENINVEIEEPSVFTQQRQRYFENANQKFIKKLICSDDTIQCDVATKLAIVNKIKKINTSRTATFDKARKAIPWEKLEILAYTEDELKTIFNEIVKDICKFRTLDEMLNDYLENYQKYELKKNVNAPKMPTNPCMAFITENRKKIEDKLKKKYPDMKIRLGDISKYGAKKFHKLPEKEKERYKQEHKDKLEKYHAQKALLLKMNPELQKKRKPPKVKQQKKKSELKEDTYLTVFKMFYRECREKDENISRLEAQKLFKNLSDLEKLKYINILVEFDTELEKRYTNDERKIMKYSTGERPKPISAYHLYLQDKYKDKNLFKDEKQVDKMKKISEMWKNESEKEKQRYKDKYEFHMKEWKEEMTEWLKTRSRTEQIDFIAKHKLNDDSTNKRKRDEKKATEASTTKKSTKQEAIIEQTPSKKKKNDKPVSAIQSDSSSEDLDLSPSKKKKNGKPISAIQSDSSSEDLDLSPSKKKKKVELVVSKERLVSESSKGEPSPSKKNKKSESTLVISNVFSKNEKADRSIVQFTTLNLDETHESKKNSPKKKDSTENILSSFGAYPSLTTAHYFMTTKCEEKKPKKVAKAYKNLSKPEKKKLYHQMCASRDAFLNKLKKQTGKLENGKIIEYHTKNKEAQAQDIAWHCPTETDNPSDSDSDTDSDDS